MRKYASPIVLFAGTLLLAISAQAASFQGLGDLPGGAFSSRAHGVSDDGTTVVGASDAGLSSEYGAEAFRWTQSTGMIGLGFLPGHTDSTAFDVSADGSTVVGTSYWMEAGELWGSGAFIWKAADIDSLPGSLTGLSMTPDGSVVVGSMPTIPGWSLNLASRWTQSSGVVGLGFLPGHNESIAHGVSADGATVVGQSFSSTTRGVGQAFLWTQGGGMSGLGTLPGYSQSRAEDVSADGSIVIGSSTSSDFGQAFRWTQSGGMVGLGFLPGGFSSSAKSMSADGSIVIGSSGSSSGDQVFIWDNAKGMRSLKTVLVNDYGLNLNGWTLSWAGDISANGRTIVGGGRNPNGNPEAWIARLDDGPSPAPTPPPASMIPTRTFDLRLVDRCDGMRLTINYGTGEVTGSRTGCASGKVSGWVGTLSGGSYDGLGVIVGYGRDMLIALGDTPQNWRIKNIITGATVASGTWAVGVP